MKQANQSPATGRHVPAQGAAANNKQQSHVVDMKATKQWLTALILANYSELHGVKVKVIGYRFSIRAKYRNRSLRATAYNPKNAIIRFFDDLNRKVYLEPYINR
jgi:hypothetical protein